MEKLDTYIEEQKNIFSNVINIVDYRMEEDKFDTVSYKDGHMAVVLQFPKKTEVEDAEKSVKDVLSFELRRKWTGDEK